MRRIVLMVSVALTTAAIMLTVAIPVFAADPHANCVGQVHSNQEQPGAAGEFHSTFVYIEPGTNSGFSTLYADAGTPGSEIRSAEGALGIDSAFCRYN